jgi:hypothetical protein
MANALTSVTAAFAWETFVEKARFDFQQIGSHGRGRQQECSTQIRLGRRYARSKSTWNKFQSPRVRQWPTYSHPLLAVHDDCSGSVAKQQVFRRGALSQISRSVCLLLLHTGPRLVCFFSL